MRKYEVMYIIRPDVIEETRNQLIAEFNQLLTDRGALELQVKEWGMRELAYEIDDLRKGYYVVLNLLANPDATIELNRVLRIKEDVLRHIIISRDE